MSARILGWSLCALLAARVVSAQGEPVSYFDDVRPILQASCHGCHQPAKAKGGITLTSYEDLLHVFDVEAAVTPGEPENSLLVDVITPRGERAPEMPVDAEPLSTEQIELIRRWIAAGAPDDTPASMRRGAGPSGPPVYERQPVVTTLAFSPDGDQLAVSGRGEVLLHSSDGTELVARLVGLSERIQSVAFSPDGKRLAVAGGSPALLGEVQVWQLEERELTLSLPVTYDTVQGVSWSNDGNRIAFGCNDSTLRVIEAESGSEVLYQGAHEDWVLGTAFSSDDSHLISVGRDRSMKLTKVDTQQFIDNITSITPGALKGGLCSVQRRPDKDELLVGGADGTPKLYRTYREKKRVIGDDYNLIRGFEPMQGRVFGVAWNAAGNRFVAGASHRGGGSVRVYDVEKPEPLWSKELPGGIYAVDFHPREERVAAAGFDGVVHLFDSESGELLHEFVPVPIAGSGQDSEPVAGHRSIETSDQGEQ